MKRKQIFATACWSIHLWPSILGDENDFFAEKMCGRIN